MELQNFENITGVLAIDESPQDSVNWPLCHSCHRAFCYRLAVLYKLCHVLFKC